MFIKMRQKKSKGGKAKHRRVPKTAAPDLSALFTAPHANQADFDFSTYSSDALFEEYGDYNYLLDSTVDTPKPPVKRRRTGTVSTDIDDDVRMAFPSSTSPGASQGIKFLLPVKGADGIQMRYQEVVTQEKPKEKNIRCVVSSAEKSPKFAPLASDPDWKKRVASLSFDVLESPEANLGCLRELLAGLGEPDLPPVKTVAVMASLVEIFKVRETISVADCRGGFHRVEARGGEGRACKSRIKVCVELYLAVVVRFWHVIRKNGSWLGWKIS